MHCTACQVRGQRLSSHAPRLCWKRLSIIIVIIITTRLTFPEGEPPLHPGGHAPDQGHPAAAVQGYSHPRLDPLIINVGAIAAVVLQHCLQGVAGGAPGGLQPDGAVQAAHPCVHHLHEAHLG